MHKIIPSILLNLQEDEGIHYGGTKQWFFFLKGTQKSVVFTCRKDFPFNVNKTGH